MQKSGPEEHTKTEGNTHKLTSQGLCANKKDGLTYHLIYFL
jgi:hypothetical protein